MTVRENPYRYIGSLVLTGFGAGWLIAWSQIYEGIPRITVVPILAVAVGLGLGSLVRFVRARKHAGGVRVPGRGARARLLFWLVVAAEAAAIYFLTSALSRGGRQEWINASVTFIVGLHFFPLAKVFHYRGYVLTGSALVLISGALPWLAPAGPGSPSLMLAAGVVLWLTAAAILARGGAGLED